jgi:hypothetical protein
MAVGSMANVDGEQNYVRIQVLTNAGALDRDKRIALVSQLTDLWQLRSIQVALRRSICKPSILGTRFFGRRPEG